MAEAREPDVPQPSVARWVVAVTVGALAFAGTWAAPVGVILVVVMPVVAPPRREAYEGFGEGMLALLLLGTGALASFVPAVVVGLKVADKVGGGRRPPPAEGGRAS